MVEWTKPEECFLHSPACCVWWLKGEGLLVPEHLPARRGRKSRSNARSKCASRCIRLHFRVTRHSCLVRNRLGRIIALIEVMRRRGIVFLLWFSNFVNRAARVPVLYRRWQPQECSTELEWNWVVDFTIIHITAVHNADDKFMYARWYSSALQAFALIE
jgi:hypothetical protein